MNATLLEANSTDLPNWLSFSQDNRSFYASKTSTGTYKVQINMLDA